MKKYKNNQLTNLVNSRFLIVPQNFLKKKNLFFEIDMIQREEW